MQRQPMGRSGLMVTPVGMGGIPLMRLEFEQGVEVIRHAFERGIRLFDTANKYNDSELKMGAALEQVRSRAVIASKSRARDAGTMARHVVLSLERLRTDYIDIYQHHQVAGMDDLKAIMAPGGAQEALEEAKAAGNIRHIGICCHNLDTAVAAMETEKFDTLQVAFNFIEHEPTQKIFPQAKRLDIGLIGMKPLGGGLLRSAHLCFGFLRDYRQIVPVPGMESKDQVDQVVDYYEKGAACLGAGDLRRMESIRAELGSRFCHRCEYCMPCPQGINIPRILHFRSIKAKYSSRDALDWVPKNADFDLVADCLQCGECVARCPYGLPIPELLAECLQFYEELKAEVAAQTHCT